MQYRAYAVANAYVDSQQPDFSGNSGDLLLCDEQEFVGGDKVSFGYRWIFLKFGDLDHQAQGKQVTSLKVGLYLKTFSVSSTASEQSECRAFIAPVLENWEEDEVTYRKLPKNMLRKVVRDTPGVSVNSSNENSYVEIELSSFDDESLSNLVQYGVIVCLVTDAGELNMGTIQANAAFADRTQEHAPYLEITAQTVTPVVTSMYPTGGFIDRRNALRLGWALGHEQSGMIGQITQKEAVVTLQAGGNSQTWKVTGSENVLEIPASEIPEGTSFQWQVQAQSEDEIWSEWSQSVELTGLDAASNAIADSPNMEYVDRSQPCTFSWTHVISTGTLPTKSRLQYGTQENVFQALKTVEGSSTFTTFPANTFPEGTIYWRVITSNAQGEEGYWSNTASFYCRETPKAPTITELTSAARPKVVWQAQVQQAYELQIRQGSQLVYKTGQVVSKDKQLLISDYLEDGEYQIRLRILDQYGIHSAWAQLPLQISTQKPTAPLVSVETVQAGAQITVQADLTVQKMYLLRDGIPIAKIYGSYTDYGCVGEHSYVVRAIGANDSFKDSETVSLNVEVPYAVIAPVDALSNMLQLALRRLSPPVHSGTTKLHGDTVHCYGRRYPVFECDDFLTQEYTPSFTYRSQTDWKQLQTLMEEQKTVLYRDHKSNHYYGIIHSNDFQQDSQGVDFSLSLQRVDYVEKIDYDMPE